MALQYIESDKRNKKLVHNGYLFFKNREKGNKIYWRCDKYHKFRCCVRLTTENDQIVQTFAFNETRHNHTVDAIEITEVRNPCQMAKTINNSPIFNPEEDSIVPKPEFSERQTFKKTPPNAIREQNNADPQRSLNELDFPDEFAKYLKFIKHGSNSNNNRSSSGNVPRSLANKQLEQNTTLISGDSDWPFDNFQSEMDASTSQNYLNPSSSSPSINSYNLNAQNSTIDTKPITVNHADIKKQQLEFLEAQMHQADVEAKKRQAEAKKRQAELAEAKKLAEKLAEEERLRKEAENKVYKYMVLNHEKKVLETLRALWKGNQFCDATLQNEFISIPVHKIVLIACCPKILETYDYIMKDTNVQVCFPRKVTAEALKAFVDYLYNGSLNLSRAILESMEYLSGMLGLDEIRQLCNQFRSDMLNDSFGIPDKTIVHVNNPHEHSSHQMSYNDHIVPPPPIVRPSTHSVAAPTAVSIQLSNFQDATPVTSVHSNNFNLFSEPHADSVLTEVSHIKLEPEPEVDLTAEDCTEIKQESLQSQLYEDANCKFEEWPSTVVEPHHPPPPPPPPSSSSSLSQPNFVQRNKNNFEMSTVDLSLTPLNAFQKQTSNNISRNISSGVITISPSNSPCPSPGLAESPSDIQTLQISNTHTISTTNTNPFPVSLISTNGQSISLTDQDNKRKHFADFDSKDDRKRSKIILN